MSHNADINLFDDENFPATSGLCLEKVHPSLLRITFTNFKQYTYERGGWVAFGFLITTSPAATGSVAACTGANIAGVL